jgi:molybdopterin-containing oxidoreductase family iron-sulfur binding subunit
MVFNPNVTVRMRGVMEKCSYCVQLVMEAKFEAKRDQYHDTSGQGAALERDEYAQESVRRRLRGGQLQSACQQVCPSGAITFGDLNDAESPVAQRANMDRSYRLLAELGTRPRTTYLAAVSNPNPVLEEPEDV